MTDAARKKILSEILEIISKYDLNFSKSEEFLELEASEKRMGFEFYAHMLIREYGEFIYNHFRISFDKGKIISKELKVCLETISELSNVYKKDSWEIIIQYLIPALIPDYYYYKEKEDWLYSLLDDSTAQLLKGYLT